MFEEFTDEFDYNEEDYGQDYDEEDYDEEDYDEEDYDNQDYEEDINMVAGVKAIERVGLPGVEVMGLGKTDKLPKNPLEYFQTKVDAISRNLISKKVDITQDDINIMLRKASLLHVVEHKNPLAYILGFLVTNGGNDIKQKNVIKVINKVLPYTNTDFVTPPDIVRYSRLWLKINLKLN